MAALKFTYRIKLRSRKGVVVEEFVEIVAKTASVNPRGDLVLLGAPTEVIAAFAVGSWLQLHREDFERV